MKISDVRWYLVEPYERDIVFTDSRLAWLFVEVTTRAGAPVLGVCWWGPPTADLIVGRALDLIRDFVIGRDAFNTESLFVDLFRRYTFLGSRGLITTIISGLDIALWDLKGRVLGRPVYELLGGCVRGEIPLYTHPIGSTAAEIVESAEQLVSDGYGALKVDPFIEGAEPMTAFLSGGISRAGLASARDLTAELRQAIGPHVDLMIDMHGRFNPSAALECITALESCGIHWFEEPVPPEAIAGLQYVRARTSVPLTVGERLYTRWDVVPLLEQRLVDYLMPDVCWTGGISEMKKIATLAEVYLVPMTPHNAQGPLQIVAGAHVMMTTPNFYRLEIHAAWLDAMSACFTLPLDIRGDILHLSDRPGLGVDLDMEYVAAHCLPRWNEP
jgi:galactonate dehydratase